jgi:hypothetical protein
MNTNRRFLVGSILTAALAGCSQNASTLTTPPDFTRDSLAGGKVSLADHRGKVVLIGFWAVG